MTEWFEEWFGEEYLRLYPHRDDADADRLVALLRRTLPWQVGWRVLDFGCGAGRHARALAAAGARPIGLDLSWSLLQRARQVSAAPLIRGDLRAPPIQPRSVDLGVNLFTSFGYFDSDAEHADALAAMAGTVRHGGWFVLDFLEADTVRNSLVPHEIHGADARIAEVDRALSPDGRIVTKTILTRDGRTFVERVRLFTPAELGRLLAAAGVEVVHRFGDYEGGSPRPGAPRAIFAGRCP
ncbi:MAG TPA: class I SAM-dependent methyltransferase [Gemmatimonadales bacterium]|nr:class I SAM-dependent methyltransferase [Gemmatimonadales bacterium]